jgi:hypothetical protein
MCTAIPAAGGSSTDSEGIDLALGRLLTSRIMQIVEEADCMSVWHQARWSQVNVSDAKRVAIVGYQTAIRCFLCLSSVANNVWLVLYVTVKEPHVL